VPQFSWSAMVELVIPLAITVLAAQNAQGIAILGSAGHRPPINAVTAACGAGSILTGLFDAALPCLTGPVTPLLVASGEPPGENAMRRAILSARSSSRGVGSQTRS